MVTEDGGAVCVFLEAVPFGCCGAGNSGAASVKRQAVNYPLFLRKSDGGCGLLRQKGTPCAARGIERTLAKGRGQQRD